MPDLIIKDKTGQELGRIRELEFGKLEAYDSLGTALATYNPRTDKTYDRLGLEIGDGNRLAWVISQAPQI